MVGQKCNALTFFEYKQRIDFKYVTFDLQLAFVLVTCQESKRSKTVKIYSFLMMFL